MDNPLIKLTCPLLPIILSNEVHVWRWNAKPFLGGSKPADSEQIRKQPLFASTMIQLLYPYGLVLRPWDPVKCGNVLRNAWKFVLNYLKGSRTSRDRSIRLRDGTRVHGANVSNDAPCWELSDVWKFWFYGGDILRSDKCRCELPVASAISSITYVLSEAWAAFTMTFLARWPESLIVR